MNHRLNNKGVSSVIAASILLAAIVTVAITYQAFIVPELDRENGFNHMLNVLNDLKELYSGEKVSIPLSYSGTPFFSSTTFTSQLSSTKAVALKIDIYNATQVFEDEQFLDEPADVLIQSLSDAIFCLNNVTDDFQAVCNFTTPQEKVTVQINSETSLSNEVSLAKVTLNITRSSHSSLYNYTILSYGSLDLPLFSPVYNLTSCLSKTCQVDYLTNSSACVLYVKYATEQLTNLTYTSAGAIKYEPNNYPLTYIATPWGITALESGTSSITSSPQINWVQDTLALDLCNITWNNVGTVSGQGVVGLKFKTLNLTNINTSFAQLNMNFTFSDISLKNSLFQLEKILENGSNQNVSVEYQEGQNWLMILIKGKGLVDLTVNDVEAILF
ncbi:MAG: hypothetical protein ACQCN5_08160 [Candidatus Bathyarchaeia archaeon]